MKRMHQTLPTQFQFVKTPKKCGRKTCRSRQAPGLMRRGIMQCIIKIQVSCRKGKGLKRLGNGWTDNEQEYYQELLSIFKELKSSDVWNTLQDHWKLYQKKHYARDDNQVEELRELEEECEASPGYCYGIQWHDYLIRPLLFSSGSCAFHSRLYNKHDCHHHWWQRQSTREHWA